MGSNFASAFAMAGREGFDFSFSGLKTALRVATGREPAETRRADLAASYQRAIVRSLVGRTAAALEHTGLDTLAVVGGVAANTALRDALAQRCAVLGVRYRAAPLALRFLSSRERDRQLPLGAAGRQAGGWGEPRG